MRSTVWSGAQDLDLRDLRVIEQLLHRVSPAAGLVPQPGELLLVVEDARIDAVQAILGQGCREQPSEERPPLGRVKLRVEQVVELRRVQHRRIFRLHGLLVLLRQRGQLGLRPHMVDIGGYRAAHRLGDAEGRRHVGQRLAVAALPVAGPAEGLWG